jgi:hypothetical protein
MAKLCCGLMLALAKCQKRDVSADTGTWMLAEIAKLPAIAGKAGIHS